MLLIETRDDATGARVVFSVTVPEGLTKLDTYLLIIANHDAHGPQPRALNLDDNELVALQS